MKRRTRFSDIAIGIVVAFVVMARGVPSRLVALAFGASATATPVHAGTVHTLRGRPSSTIQLAWVARDGRRHTDTFHVGSDLMQRVQRQLAQQARGTTRIELVPDPGSRHEIGDEALSQLQHDLADALRQQGPQPDPLRIRYLPNAPFIVGLQDDDGYTRGMLIIFASFFVFFGLVFKIASVVEARKKKSAQAQSQ